MIRVRYASIIAVAAFVAGSFFASPELRAYASTIANDVICNGCVGTSDLAGNVVTAAKIKDGEVKAAEIATDAVGAAELQGVTKLLFGKCVVNSTDGTRDVPSGANILIVCAISGVDTNDRAIASLDAGGLCFDVRGVHTLVTNKVTVNLKNDCPFTDELGTGAEISIMVFDK
jgi:hypothetical protein